MIYKKIETTTEEVLEFMREAGIEIEDTPGAKAFQIRLSDNSVIEMPPDLNIFGDMSLYTTTAVCSYDFFITEKNNNNYVSGGLRQDYDNYVSNLMYIPAA